MELGFRDILYPSLLSLQFPCALLICVVDSQVCPIITVDLVDKVVHWDHLSELKVGCGAYNSRAAVDV